MTNWIKCSEKMPELDCAVLAWDGNVIDIRFRTEGFNNYIHWVCNEFMEREEITHWMPFPEPPKD